MNTLSLFRPTMGALVILFVSPHSWGVEFGTRAGSLGYWTETLLVENATAETVNLTGDPRATVTGAHADDYVVALQPAAGIPASGTAYVKVTFNPSAPGLRSATLEIPTDSSTLGTISIALEGTGGSPPVTDLNTNVDHDLSGVHSGSIRLLQGKLNLTGDLTIEGDLLVEGGTVAFNGFNLTVERDFRLVASVTIQPGGPTLQIGGNFLQANGWLNPNGSAVEIGGDYRIQIMSEDGSGVLSFSSSPGRMEMNAPADAVTVHGNFVTDSSVAHTGTTLSQGILELRGDFTQLSSSAETRSFQAGVSHRVVLAGEGPQLVSFEDPVSSKFGTLEIQNPGPGAVTLAPEFNASTLISNEIPLAPLTIGATSWNLGADEIIEGDLRHEGAGRNLNLNGHTLTVRGDLIHSAGRLDVAAGALIVEGDYRNQTDNGDGTYGVGAGQLEMNHADDAVTVLGNFVTDSSVAHTSTTLSQGTLELRGDFTQLSSSAETRSFQATGDHRVVLAGEGPQVVSFEDPVSSKFGTLEIENPGPGAVTLVPEFNTTTLISNGIPLAPLTIGATSWNLSADEIIEGDLRHEGAGRNLNLNGHTLTVRGDLIHSAGRLDVAAGVLIVEGDYRNQTDNGDGTYGVGAGQLEMNHADDAVTVLGNFVTDSSVAHTSTTLSQGTLELRGDFTQLSSSAETRSFQATGDHRVVLAGEGPQVVSFEDPVSSKFGTLEIQNSGPGAVTLAPEFNASTLISNGIPLAPLTVRSTNWNLSADEIIEGDLRLEGSGRTLGLNGHSLTVRGDLIHSGHRLDVAAGALIVEGDYRNQTDNGDGTYGVGSGQLEMNHTDDLVTVLGNFVTDSTIAHTGTTLSAGTLAVGGDFTQLSTSAEARSFQPSLSHRVVLTGDGAQAVSFEDPTQSNFRNLEFLNNPAALITFDTRARVTALFDHHQRAFVLSPDVQDTDFQESDGDGLRDHVDVFPVDDSNDNGVPDDATPENYNYDAWRRIHFWEGDPEFEAKTAPEVDLEGDGIPNLLEYLMGTIPTRANANPIRFSIEINPSDGEGYLAITFPRVVAALGSAQIDPEASEFLAGEWIENSNVSEVLGSDGEIEMVRVLDTVPVTSALHRFMRLTGALLP